MPNELSIIVDAVLNPDSLKNIQNEIKTITDKKDAGTINIQLDGIDKVLSGIKNINEQLNTLRQPININVNYADISRNIRNIIRDAQREFNRNPIDIPLRGRRDGGNGNGGGRNGRGGGGGGRNNQHRDIAATRVPGMAKYRSAMMREVGTYSADLRDKGARILRTDVSWDPNSGDYRGIIQYQNALGKTAQAVLTLDRATNVYRVSQTRVTTNFEKQRQFLDQQTESIGKLNESLTNGKTPLKDNYLQTAQTAIQDYQRLYDTIYNTTEGVGNRLSLGQAQQLEEGLENVRRIIAEQRQLQSEADALAKRNQQITDRNSKIVAGYDSDYAELESKAYRQANPLQNEFKANLDSVLQSWHDEIDAVRQQNTEITQDQINNLNKLKDQAKLAYKEQYASEYQGLDLTARDISTQKPRMENLLGIEEEKIRQSGIVVEDLTNKVADLRAELGNVADQNDLKKWSDKFRELQSAFSLEQQKARTEASSPAGRGRAMADSITGGQLESIKEIEKVLDAQPNTEGFKKVRSEISQIQVEYQKLRSELSKGDINEDVLRGAESREKQLDQQLRTYQTLAKNLNGDMGSQKWVDSQKLGIEKMKASFSEYQQEISKTIQLTPDLQSKMQMLSDTMNRSGAVDVANWREVQTQFEQLKISVDQFKNSVQGQASALSINIETNKLQEVTGLLDKLNNTTVQSSGIASVRTELEALSTQYQEVVTQLQNPNLGEEEFKKLSDTVDELDKRFTTLSNRTSDSFLQKYQLDADNLSQRFEKLKQKYEDFVKVNPNGGNAELEASFERIQESINNINPDNISIVQKEVRNLGTEVSRVVGPSQTLGQVLRDSFGGLGGYLARFASGAAIIQKTISVIRSMVTEVKALDSSLVELQKVTGLTGDALSQFTDKAYQVGSSLGRTGQDVIDAVTTFSRAGYELKEATDLAQAALVMTNIGPDITSTESAASDMISIFKAYEIEAEDAMGVIDRLYNVANKEPLDFGNITQMLVTAGGTLAQTGTSLNETMGLLTSAFATMRDESVANG